MSFKELFDKCPKVCINLKNRKKKRKQMVKQAKTLNTKFKFFEATLHDNPKRGCLESHLSVIRNAIKSKHKYILILEDDALFVKPIKKLPKAPSGWDMLYLGGTVKHIFSKEKHEHIQRRQGSFWVRMTCWTTHAYIVNLQNKELVKAILDSEKCEKNMEIDRYYVDKIHTQFKCYMINPMVCIQRSGHSDIEGRDIDYNFMEKSLLGLTRPPHEISLSGDFRLKMPDIPFPELPGVTIITPTRDRDWIFSMPILNFQRFMYPVDKLEWIVIDSSETDDLKYLLPTDSRVKYINVKEPCTIAHKRNLGCENAKYDIIVHMDDDDIYPPESILARVKLLVGTPGIDCVGCSRIGVYDIINNRSHMASDGHLSLAEASMAYKKSFWQENQFDPACERGEYFSFLMNRLDRVMDLPYVFVIIAMNHKKNLTNRTAWYDGKDPGKEEVRDADTGKIVNYLDSFDDDLKQFLISLRVYLLKMDN